MGVVLVQYKDIQNPSLGLSKRHVDPSWRTAGYVSTVTLDNKGNAYILPSAMVNTIHNPADGTEYDTPDQWEDRKNATFFEIALYKTTGKRKRLRIDGLSF